jgi:hypothetical protein
MKSPTDATCWFLSVMSILIASNLNKDAEPLDIVKKLDEVCSSDSSIDVLPRSFLPYRNMRV